MAKSRVALMFLVAAMNAACMPAAEQPPATSATGGAAPAPPPKGTGGSAPAPAPAPSGTGGTVTPPPAPPADAAPAPADTAPAPEAAPPGDPPLPPAPPPAGANPGLAQKLLGGAIGLGYYTACHVVADNSLRCFGDRHPRTMPPAGLKTTQITCAHDGCCVLQPKEAGARIRCWSDKRTIFPPDAVARAVDPVQIAIGYQHGCALNADHSVTCWGQPGTKNEPPAGLKAKSLHAAAFYNCAITMDDSVVCWGHNPPMPPADLKAKLVSAIVHTGGHLDEAPGLTRHACAIQLDDKLRCWGDNIDGTTDVPADLGPVRDVGVNTYTTCALKPDGTMVCFGTRRYFPDRYKAPPADLKLKAIKGQFGGFCGMRLDDTLACWGEEKTSHITVPAGLKLYVPPS